MSKCVGKYLRENRKNKYAGPLHVQCLVCRNGVGASIGVIFKVINVNIRLPAMAIMFNSRAIWPVTLSFLSRACLRRRHKWILMTIGGSIACFTIRGNCQARFLYNHALGWISPLGANVWQHIYYTYAEDNAHNGMLTGNMWYCEINVMLRFVTKTMNHSMFGIAMASMSCLYVFSAHMHIQWMRTGRCSIVMFAFNSYYLYKTKLG